MKEDLDKVVDLAMEASPQDNPRPVDEIGVQAILGGAYEDRRTSFPSRERLHLDRNEGPHRVEDSPTKHTKQNQEDERCAT